MVICSGMSQCVIITLVMTSEVKTRGLSKLEILFIELEVRNGYL